jgi:hypothetical protein
MQLVLLIPFFLQIALMTFDEFLFHIKRPLPLWERIGHPLDTLSFIATVAFACYVPYSPLHLKIYIALAAFSCLMITKDEFVHKHHCPTKEMWLHACLFINHPLLLISNGLLWWMHEGSAAPWLSFLAFDKETTTFIFSLQLFASTSFMFYQIWYWNILWPRKKNR